MKVHEQRDQYKAMYALTIQGLQEIRSYLNSDKFLIDVNVNKNDILMRINELDNALFCESIKLV